MADENGAVASKKTELQLLAQVDPAVAE